MTFLLRPDILRLLTGLFVASALLLAAGAASAAESTSRPNIVLVLTDDEDVALHGFMPRTKALIEDEGTRFTNFFVSYPFCCPSRASILRGQYAHNTGVGGNAPPLGGYEVLHARGLEQSTLATWLADAGYRTAMVGKYINRYSPAEHGVPPGWSDWYVGGNAHPSYNYDLNENGEVVHYGSRPEDYLNDVLTEKAVGVIRRAAAAGEPFFLYVLPYNPHSPSVAAPRHAGLFADAPLPRSPSFDEADVSDKPAIMRRLPRIDDRRLASLEDEYRRRLRSIQAVDDMVARLVETLKATRTLANTYFIYSSDNGFHMGEHRLSAGKVTPYDEDIRVPMVMRGPGVPKGQHIDALALNIDLAPTIAEIAGVAPPAFVDGRSLMDLFTDPDLPWRKSILIERRQHDDTLAKLAAANGASPQEIEQSAHFDGLRTEDWTYVEYATGERELYDLTNDPFQLVNEVDTAPPALVAAASARLAELATCAAGECRRLENLPVSVEPPLVSSGGPEIPATPAVATGGAVPLN